MAHGNAKTECEYSSIKKKMYLLFLLVGLKGPKKSIPIFSQNDVGEGVEAGVGGFLGYDFPN